MPGICIVLVPHVATALLRHLHEGEQVSRRGTNHVSDAALHRRSCQTLMIDGTSMKRVRITRP
jgi:hypothetical protein